METVDTKLFYEAKTFYQFIVQPKSTQ